MEIRKIVVIEFIDMSGVIGCNTDFMANAERGGLWMKYRFEQTCPLILSF